MNITTELQKSIKEYQEAKAMEKEAKAAMSDAKDNLTRDLLSMLEAQGYSQDSTLYVDGATYCYRTTERAVVDPSLFLTLYEQGKISREVFLDCISVGKEKAEAHLGKATVEPFISIKEGEKADLRVGKADKKSALAVGVSIEGTRTKTESQFSRKLLLKMKVTK